MTAMEHMPLNIGGFNLGRRQPMKALKTRIQDMGLTMTCQRSDSNPHMEQDSWSATAHHWRVTLHHGSKRLRTFFSQGSGYTQPPTIEDVLNCLADDAAGHENAQSFEDWASEYGFDSDSRRALRDYQLIGRQAQALKNFLGEAYHEVLFDTERV
jgi:hypothetical protein